ncbi:hypothetical protein [Pedomonas mirosovicensis]|uniref:hypothetical protein n=1 Tax=Pedomonas mirosovicensis TaxID=2908641 RepID=UPI00216A72E3|nr:hypothetical protein [Pedomonas mirosovicensis]MCH8685061.1 hypothetical protein [Pedomonas mirosovicensis]
MHTKDRPLSNEFDEAKLNLISACIIREWSRISLRLRVCLKALGVTVPRVSDPFGLHAPEQISQWSRSLTPHLIGKRAAELQRTVGKLRKAVKCRNAICHGEPQWNRDALGDYQLYFTLATLEARPPKQGTQDLLRQPLQLFNNGFLQPDEAEVYVYDIDELTKLASEMPALRQSVENLSAIAVSRSGRKPAAIRRPLWRRQLRVRAWKARGMIVRLAR